MKGVCAHAIDRNTIMLDELNRCLICGKTVDMRNPSPFPQGTPIDVHYTACAVPLPDREPCSLNAGHDGPHGKLRRR